MAINKQIRDRIQVLKTEYDQLKAGKNSLLQLLDEAEIAESVYNSNAIENSTLTLQETEKILLEQELSRDISIREVFEAKNLARVSEYIRSNINNVDVNKDILLFLHKMLLMGINDDIAGRFREKDEYVRVGTHIAPAPEKILAMLKALFLDYQSNIEIYPIDKIAKWHLDFEMIHPFIDGNGRIGRVLINIQLLQRGFPSIILRFKERDDYYKAFQNYKYQDDTKLMEKLVALSLLESFHKRVTYLKGENIITLSDYAKKHDKTSSALHNAAKRQTIPAFRERGVWKIADTVVL